MRMQPDGSGMNEVLDVAGGEITDLAFAPDGTLWMTTIEADGGKLCRVSNDQWGVTVEPVVTQIDGKALSCPAAVAVGADGKVYFTNAADVSVKYGLESALRTELLAHTATGWVYVYDPVTRAVERVLGGVAGASGLALSADGGTLYVSDLGSRCIWGSPVRWTGADGWGQGLCTAGRGPARIPRGAGSGGGRHGLGGLPLGAFRLAGRPRRRHPAAGCRPPAE